MVHSYEVEKKIYLSLLICSFISSFFLPLPSTVCLTYPDHLYLCNHHCNNSGTFFAHSAGDFEGKARSDAPPWWQPSIARIPLRRKKIYKCLLSGSDFKTSPYADVLGRCDCRSKRR